MSSILWILPIPFCQRDYLRCSLHYERWQTISVLSFYRMICGLRFKDSKSIKREKGQSILFSLSYMHCKIKTISQDDSSRGLSAKKERAIRNAPSRLLQGKKIFQSLSMHAMSPLFAFMSIWWKLSTRWDKFDFSSETHARFRSANQQNAWRLFDWNNWRLGKNLVCHVRI